MKDDEEIPRRRESDRLGNRIKEISAIVSAIGIIGGAIIFITSMFFQTTKEAQACETRFSERFKELEVRQNEADNTLVELKTDVKYIREGITDLRARR